jgi:hypothetical protein
LAGCLIVAPRLARADDSVAAAPNPAPRAELKIGDFQGVPVSTDDKLYAFVEQWPGNRPAGNAEIEITDGSCLDLAKAGDGMFIARFNRTGHLRDALMVMQSAGRIDEQPTEIAYDDLPDAHRTVGHQRPIALATGGIGAAIAGLALLGMRHWQRNVLGGSPGTKTG